jgi:hypothetical protein
MPTFEEKDIPLIVLHQMASRHPNWSVGEAKRFYEARLRTWREADVIAAVRRAAYAWADGVGEETIEDMLSEYYRSHTSLCVAA